MKTIGKIRAIYRDNRLSFYASIAGPFAMGTVHLVATIMQFSWLTLNYCLFSYMLLAMKCVLVYLDRSPEKRKILLAGALSLAALMIPMTVAMVKTIREREAPAYIFSWLIYVYATYGTVKFIMAVRARHKARKSGDICKGVLSWISLVSAAYTIQMMEFALIATFDTGGSYSMMIMQYLTHGAILVFTVFIIINLIVGFGRQTNDGK